jgi:hypothetical protein
LLIDLVTLGGQTPGTASASKLERVVFFESMKKSLEVRNPMHFDMKQVYRVATAFVLTVAFALPQNLLAEGATHVVSPSDLQQASVQASTARQQNVEQVRQFFSSEKAGKALRSAHLNPEQVRDAVSTLDDAELAQLASKVQKTQADFAAGSLSDRDLIIILVAVAILILIIVAVR